MHVVIPETAPFEPAQRAWLNGFLAGLLGMEQALQGAPAPALAPAPETATQPEDFPWHDPTLALEDRLKLAEHRPPQQQVMAALGQLDCGQCGYMCTSYAEAITSGADTDAGKCVPGGRPTAKAVKILLARFKADGSAMPVATQPAKPQLSAERGYHRDLPAQAAQIETHRVHC